MSALDDLLLKKYRDAMGESANMVSEAAGAAAPESNIPKPHFDIASTSYASSEPNVSTFEPSQDVETADAKPAIATYASAIVNDEPGPETVEPEAAEVSREVEVTEASELVASELVASGLEASGLEASGLEASESEATEPDTLEVTEEVEIATSPEDIAPPAVPEANEAVEQAVAASTPTPTSFKPDWEIDRFPWPSICDEIEERVESELGRAIAGIMETCQSRDSNSVVITSARSGAGRTTMSLCLAREAARQGKTVAIVDLDHAEPCMLEAMGIEFEQGIESLQQQDVTAESICVTAVEDGVSLLPTVNPFNPTHCVSEETREMLRAVASNHDLVIIDASREVADLIAGCRELPTQAMIMVSDPGANEATEAFIEWMKEKDAFTLGVIENFAA